MNDAKSAPFAHIPYVKNPCIPPKISKSHNFGKLSEIRRPFRFARRKLELAKFTAIAQNSHNSLIVVQITRNSHNPRQFHTLLRPY